MTSDALARSATGKCLHGPDEMCANCDPDEPLKQLGAPRPFSADRIAGRYRWPEARTRSERTVGKLPEGLTAMFLLNVGVCAEGIVDVEPATRKALCDKLLVMAQEMREIEGAQSRADKQRDELLMLSEPWPLHEVVRKLADAADHLLTAHACDTHGHEEIATARDVARRWLYKRFGTLLPLGERPKETDAEIHSRSTNEQSDAEARTRVKRYKPTVHATMLQDDDGFWVRLEDYSALEGMLQEAHAELTSPVTDAMVERALEAANGAMVDTRRHWTAGDRAAVRAMLETVARSSTSQPDPAGWRWKLKSIEHDQAWVYGQAKPDNLNKRMEWVVEPLYTIPRSASAKPNTEDLQGWPRYNK